MAQQDRYRRSKIGIGAARSVSAQQDQYWRSKISESR